jgi:hypothetical protein
MASFGCLAQASKGSSQKSGTPHGIDLHQFGGIRQRDLSPRLMVATIGVLASVTPEIARRDKPGETRRFSAETLSLPSAPRE